MTAPTIYTTAGEIVAIVDAATPPPQPGTTIVSLGLHYSRAGLLPFAFGQTFKRGDVPAGVPGVVADCAEFQCVPVNHFDDGSVRDADVAGYVNVAAPGRVDVALSLGAPVAGAVAAAPPAVAVEVGGVAVTTIERKPLVSGPVMAQERIRARIDALTWVEWEQRTFRGGEIEVLVPEIYNAGFSTPAQPNRVLALRVVIGGTEAFNEPVDVKNHTHIALLRGSKWSTWIGGDPSLLPEHDRAYLCACDSIPPFAVGPVAPSVFAGLPQSYQPNYVGMDGGMGATGYDEAVGVVSRSSATVCTTAGAKAWNHAWAEALAHGSYSVHLIDETTGELPLLAPYPTKGTGESGANKIPTGSGPVNTAYKIAHHWSAAYVLAKLTGWYRLRDQVMSWAVWNHFANRITLRQNERGLLRTDAGTNSVRGAAWALRTLFQAIASAPHDHPLLPDLVRVAGENMAWYRARHVDGTIDGGSYVNNLGLFSPYTSNPGQGLYDVPNSVAWWDSPWMQAWVGMVLGQAVQMRLAVPANTQANLNAVFAHGAKLLIGLCGDGSAGAFNWRRFGIYDMPIAPDETKPANGQWYADMGAVRAEYERAKNVGTLDPAPGGFLVDHSSNSPVDVNDWTRGRIGFMWPNLVYGVMHNQPGALAALARVMSSSSWPLIAAGRDNPLWAGLMPPGYNHPGA